MVKSNLVLFLLALSASSVVGKWEIVCDKVYRDCDAVPPQGKPFCCKGRQFYDSCCARWAGFEEQDCIEDFCQSVCLNNCGYDPVFVICDGKRYANQCIADCRGVGMCEPGCAENPDIHQQGQPNRPLIITCP